MDKRIFKMKPEELQLFLHFKKRGFKIENKKGKGSYKRNPKHKEVKYNDWCRDTERDE